MQGNGATFNEVSNKLRNRAFKDKKQLHTQACRHKASTKPFDLVDCIAPLPAHRKTCGCYGISIISIFSIVNCKIEILSIIGDLYKIVISILSTMTQGRWLYGYR